MFRRLLRLVWRYCAPFRLQFSLLGVLLLAGIGLQLLAPHLLATVINQISQPTLAAQAPVLGVAFFLVIVAERLLAFARIALGHTLGQRAVNQLRSELLGHVLNLDLGFHTQRSPGVLLEQLDGDTGALADLFGNLAVRLVANLLLIGGIVAVMLASDLRLGLGMLGFLALFALVMSRVQDRAVADFTGLAEAGATLVGFVEERLGGREDLRAARAEVHTLDQHTTLHRALLVWSRRAHLRANFTFVAANGLVGLGYAMSLAAGALLVLRNEASLGEAFVLVSYVGLLAGPLEGLRSQIEALQAASASAARVDALFAERSALSQTPRAQRVPSGPLGLSLVQVSFRYQPTNSLVLSNLTLHLQPGQRLGLLGRTGSGKSSLARLITRLYDPTSGQIRLGGHDLRDLPLAELRTRIGVVTQDVQLLQASLAENLSLFDPAIAPERMQAALAELGLGPWLASLPDGLNTQLGPGGRTLSAGEAQLIAFARVLLRDPGLVILDEASSRLDPASEAHLELAIERLLAGRTAIVIAHRLATVERLDQIAVLEAGQIIEHGPRTALASDPSSHFARLLRLGLEEVSE